MFKRFLVTVLAAISNLAAAGLSGKWTGTLETNGNLVRVFVTLNLFQASTGATPQDPVVSGTVATGDETKAVPIENAEIHGFQLTFQTHDDAGRIVSFRLYLTNGLMRGETNVGDQISKLTLSPAEFGFFPIAGGLSAPPVLFKKTEPQYTEEARAAKIQGTVLLYVEINPAGNATNMKVVRSLGRGLDEKAIEAVKQWKFKPGYKNGTPVTSTATIEVNFRL